MSTFRAFQTGLAAGQEQRKYRDENDARTQAAEAFKSGNFEGAVAPLMRVGLMQEADAYGAAGQRKQETERTQTYAQAYKTGLGAGPAPNKVGGYKAVQDAAMGLGDIDYAAQIDEFIGRASDQEKARLAESMEFLGQTALNLKGVPPEARGQAAMEILQGSPLANPQIMQQIQQAAADGKITDEELDNFAMQTMSVADRVKLNKPETPRYSTATTRDGIIAYNTADPTQTQRLGSAPLPASQQGPQAPPSGYRWTANGGLEPIPGGPADKPAGQSTEGERAAGLHAGISINGLQNLQRMEAGGYNRAGVSEQAGGLLGGENERLYDQAADEFIDGYLRAMTGAAATPAEIAQYRRQWFPSFGDSPPVVQQKAEGRLNAIKQMKSKTGRSWNPEWDAIIADLERQVGGADAQKMPPGLTPELQRIWQMGTPTVRQEILTRMGGAQPATAQAAPPPAAADLGDDELRAMLGL